MKFTFPHGIHVKDNKDITKSIPLRNLDAPEKVYICLSQHIGKPSDCVVKPGDKVKCGTLIGAASGAFSANIYSSVSGEVEAIADRVNAQGIMCKHVVIKNDFSNEEVHLPSLDLDKVTADDIIERIKTAGIVGMGGAGFPTHIKLKPQDKVDTLIINGAECEPYITCDYRLMLEKSKEVIAGAVWLKKALGVEKVYIGIEDNKMSAVEALKNVAHSDIEVIAVKEKYPQGAERQLIYSVTKRKVPAGALPAKAGVVVENIHTAYSVYEAMELNKPLYSRALTVSGRAIDKPGNFFVPTGVTYDFLLSRCSSEGDIKVAKVISGGPMMGFAQASLDAAICKNSSAVLFLTKEETDFNKPSACINCARCARACPMRLMPMFIDSCVISGDLQGAKKYGLNNCIECGSCAYVCPAKRSIVQSVRQGKRLDRASGGK